MWHRLTLGFPLWTALACALALLHPPMFLAVNQGPWLVLLLALIMLSMGLTLRLDDFKRLRSLPKAVGVGFVAQYSIMPLLAYGIAMALALPPYFAVGLILVGCCPGGTASNLVSYIAKADVALSVVMTVCSTLAAVLMTPWLTLMLAGALVPVDVWLLFKQTFTVVIVPIVLGVLLNHSAPKLVARVVPVAPFLAVLGVSVICGAVFAANAEWIQRYGLSLVGAVVLLHASGFALGGVLAKWLSVDGRSVRTIAIEVGMQNSGLAIVLAKQAFPQMLLTPMVGAVSAIVHSVLGSMLAVYWRMKPVPESRSSG